MNSFSLPLVGGLSEEEEGGTAQAEGVEFNAQAF